MIAVEALLIVQDPGLIVLTVFSEQWRSKRSLSRFCGCMNHYGPFPLALSIRRQINGSIELLLMLRSHVLDAKSPRKHGVTGVIPNHTTLETMCDSIPSAVFQ